MPIDPPQPQPRRRRAQRARAAIGVALVALFALAIARLDLRPDLRHVKVSMLSGSAEGNYHAIVDRVSAAAARKKGRVNNVPTEGSLDNVARLAAASRSCEAEFALVQAGLPWPEGKLELVAQLAKGESVFMLGKDADRISDWASFARLRVGVGPDGSGTAKVAHEILGSRDLAGLGIELSNHTNAEQLDLAARGDLDLAIFVMDEDAAFIEAAMRDRGLQMVGLEQADVIARRYKFLRHGRIGAGQFDPVRMLPPVDKQVLRINTLVVGNGCAPRSQTIGLLRALHEVYPELVRHNREAPNATSLDLSPAAKSYFEHDGPEIVDEYLPRAGDVMPPSNWVHVVMGLSILFNLMGLGNRFVLWRIDAARVRAEQEIAHAFGPSATLGDIARLDPSGAPLGERVGDEVDRVIHELEELAARSRRMSLSVLVPMGHEMAYRYQEQLIHETLSVLRAFRDRRREARGRAD